MTFGSKGISSSTVLFHISALGKGGRCSDLNFLRRFENSLCRASTSLMRSEKDRSFIVRYAFVKLTAGSAAQGMLDGVVECAEVRHEPSPLLTRLLH